MTFIHISSNYIVYLHDYTHKNKDINKQIESNRTNIMAWYWIELQSIKARCKTMNDHKMKTEKKGDFMKLQNQHGNPKSH